MTSNVARASRLPTLDAQAGADYRRQHRGQFAAGVLEHGDADERRARRQHPDLPGRSPRPRASGRRRRSRASFVSRSSEPSARSSQASRAAFANYQAAQEAIQAQTVAVQANELALEGNRAEQTVGTRTIIEVLNAEQELLNSQVALVTAKRDAYVAGFQLLNAMGQAEAQDLGLDGGPLYDPLGNYRRVADNWSDWATDPAHVPTATRTVSPQEMPANPIVTPKVAPARNDPAPPTAPGVTTPPPPALPPRRHRPEPKGAELRARGVKS